ncbi:MAG: hypothetical protein PHO15_03605 [Eubacteriales bacterium]|nr:hypothetical protein [Eubacteriales bacterium]
MQKDVEFYVPYLPDDHKTLNKIKEIAENYGIKRIQAESAIKSYLQIPSFTCIINPYDVNPTKGHKAAIKKGQKFLDYEIVNADKVNNFMDAYFEIAGKQTRPNQTFKILRHWIEYDYGTLIKAAEQGNTAGYAFILHYEGQAYYFMSCIYPEYQSLNVGHYIQHATFEVLRKKGICHYELGEQFYNSLTYQPTVKERNISLFKRGFGGEIVYKPRSEYFFDPDYMKQTYEQKIIKYLEAIR